mmetsp:Transcript_16300/g.24017  ORF Transcript_16300/g.24017 Transcript_16300/m.24017 type:complete len:475 (-) Transcript_16300:178-1602(-)|eukprot:CAMPEP_0116019962 /NCGR_PEP_ID=MMETSP0321-20121206/9532_1 /TAXON_ID=163516 /ORGANISM="Leptocylindrus danicus var. danicus, Strain B650" /LENGTH=474 /DNA_ID=CAMNT_0003490599 /DNA_START=299 /DNA_END=1723 /DNA_ORIENTATION=+
MEEVEINVAKQQAQAEAPRLDDENKLTRIEKIRRTCSFNRRTATKNRTANKRDDIDFHAGLIVTVSQSVDYADDSASMDDHGLGGSTDHNNFLTENYKNYSDMPEAYLKQHKSTDKSEHSAEESFFDTIHNNQIEATAGLAALTSAALVVHPVLFLAGVMWAVGLYKSAEAGVVYFNDEAFKRIFWWDEEQPSEAETNEEKLVRLQQVKAEVEKEIKMEKSGSFEADDGATTQTEASSTTATSVEEDVAIENLPRFVRTEQLAGNITGFLECLIYDEQFNVLFQTKQGDDEIVYTKWQNETDSHMTRKITFKTLTKSYFGPAYAHATKTQHIHFFRGNGKARTDDPECDAVIIDSVTKLKDIPYAEKFWVTERWVLRSIDRNIFTVDLSFEVYFTKKLKIEELIIGKSAQKVKEITKLWIKAARPKLNAYNKAVAKKEASTKIAAEKALICDGVEMKILGNVRDIEVLDKVMLP